MQVLNKEFAQVLMDLLYNNKSLPDGWVLKELIWTSIGDYETYGNSMFYNAPEERWFRMLFVKNKWGYCVYEYCEVEPVEITAVEYRRVDKK